VRKNKLKKYISFFLCILLLAVTAACSSEKSSGSGDEEKDKSKKTVTIAYRNTTNEGLVKLLEKAEPSFEENHPGVNVEVIPIQASSKDFFTKLALMMKSDETAPDVITEDTFMIESDASAEYLEPLTDYVQEWSDWDQFYDEVKTGVSASDGEVYGVPYTADKIGLWYNAKEFKEVGLPVPWKPETWQDVEKAAKVLKEKAPGVIPYIGYSGTASGEATTMFHFEMLLYGTENTLYDYEQEKWVVKSPGFLDSLKFINNMYSNELGPKLSTILEAQAPTVVEQELAPEGKVGILLSGTWLPGVWESVGFNKWDETYNITAMPTQNGQEPGSTAMAGGWAFSVYKGSKNKDLAFEFITHLTSKENNFEYSMNQGSISPRKDVTKIPDYEKNGVNKQASEFSKFAHYRPAFEKYPLVSSEVQKAVEAVASGSLSPEKAMEQYAESVTRIVGEENVKTVK
jgi:multiple sugar transport system substrate-binding protein